MLPFKPVSFCVILWLLLISTIALPAYSQRLDTAAVAAHQTAVALNYLGIAALQERGIGRHTTLLYGAGAHYSFYGAGQPALGTRFINVIDKYFGRNYTTSGITPYVFLEGRRYLNLLRRAEAGKNTRHNAGTYLGLFGELPFATGNLINVPNLALGYPVGIKVGMRRSVGRAVYVDGSAALVDRISNRQRTVLPRLDVALAWVL